MQQAVPPAPGVPEASSPTRVTPPLPEAPAALDAQRSRESLRRERGG
jgi:hypothetical protein